MDISVCTFSICKGRIDAVEAVQAMDPDHVQARHVVNASFQRPHAEEVDIFHEPSFPGRPIMEKVYFSVIFAHFLMKKLNFELGG